MSLNEGADASTVIYFGDVEAEHDGLSGAGWYWMDFNSRWQGPCDTKPQALRLSREHYANLEGDL